MKKNDDFLEENKFNFYEFMDKISDKRIALREFKNDDSVFLFNEENGQFLNFYDVIQQFEIENKKVEEKYFSIEGKSDYSDAEMIEFNEIRPKYLKIQDFQRDLTNFTSTMKVDFMMDYKAFLNTLCTVKTYAKFKNVTEITVRNWIKARKLDMIYLDECMFIMVSKEEFIPFNLYLLQKKVKKDGGFKDNGMLMKIHEAVSGDKVKVETKNSVELYFEYRDISTTPYGGNPKSKIKIRDEWVEYCGWCKTEGVDPVTIAVFSKWIGRLGFKKFNFGYRGFYSWTKLDFGYLAGCSVVKNKLTLN